jgi:S-adenosylmethionine hydrolase
MKGVILRINPQALVVDVSHDVEAHDIMEGAVVLANAYGHFPVGTIHVAVVDPGVGSQRRPIIVETSQGYFVGPDNGLFTLIYERETIVQTVTIENPRFTAATISRTFHGRDVFAPAAAHLSLGVSVERFGSPAESEMRVALPHPQARGDAAEGEVIHVDRFGNLITNISADLFAQCIGRGPHTIRVGKHEVSGPYESYEDGRGEEAFGIFGSSGLLEISVKKANAQKALDVGRGTVVRVARFSDGGGDG